MDAQERTDLVRELMAELEQRSYPDAGMLRKVAGAREALRDVADVLDTLERYFTPPPFTRGAL
jgi:hypothetical protein